MKRFILVLAILAVALPVAAHNPIQEAQEAIANLQARADLADSRGLNQGAALEELFRLVDNLNARVDALAGGANNQSAAIDDLYEEVDALRAHVGMADKAPEPEE